MRQPTLLDFIEYLEEMDNQNKEANVDDLQQTEPDDEPRTSCRGSQAWSPEQIDDAPDVEEYNFSEILDILTSTDAFVKVKRTTWGDVAVCLVTQTTYVMLDDQMYTPQPYFTMLSGNTMVAWQPDTEDILADNWIIDDA